MRIATLLAATIVAAGAGGLAGYEAATIAGPWSLSRITAPFSHIAAPFLESAPTSAAPTESAAASADRPILYWHDPSGRPAYSAKPAKTADGRDFAPVYGDQEPDFGGTASAANAPSTPAPAAKSGERKVLYYRNPMGLPDTSPVPKKDSMGMDYIPVYEGEDEGSTVRVSLDKVQKTGVRSETVTRRVISRPVRAPGSIQLDERRIGVISLRADAFIEYVGDVTTGDRVRKGQPLMRLYSPDIAAAAAQYLTSLGGTTIPDGARRRLDNLAVPAEVVAEIERTRKVPVSVVWPSPWDGIVLERTVVHGMRATTGEALFRLADISSVWVLADVPERELALVKPGQTATIRPRSMPDRTFTGRVALIYPGLNKETRTARVRIELPNPDSLLLPDMYADVEIASGGDRPVVAAPDSAIVDSGTRQVVFLDKGEGRFEPREVKLGRRGDGYAEIREGLTEGDKVVVAANFLIDAESNLKAALRSFTASEPAQ